MHSIRQSGDWKDRPAAFDVELVVVGTIDSEITELASPFDTLDVVFGRASEVAERPDVVVWLVTGDQRCQYSTDIDRISMEQDSRMNQSPTEGYNHQTTQRNWCTSRFEVLQRILHYNHRSIHHHL